MEGLRAWKDCPACNGRGEHDLDHLGEADMTKNYMKPCPTCAAHWAGVDEAVKARYEKDRKMVREYPESMVFSDLITIDIDDVLSPVWIKGYMAALDAMKVVVEDKLAAHRKWEEDVQQWRKERGLPPKKAWCDGN